MNDNQASSPNGKRRPDHTRVSGQKRKRLAGAQNRGYQSGADQKKTNKQTKPKAKPAEQTEMSWGIDLPTRASAGERNERRSNWQSRRQRGRLVRWCSRSRLVRSSHAVERPERRDSAATVRLRIPPFLMLDGAGRPEWQRNSNTRLSSLSRPSCRRLDFRIYRSRGLRRRRNQVLCWLRGAVGQIGLASRGWGGCSFTLRPLRSSG